MHNRVPFEFILLELASNDCPARLRRAVGAATKHLYVAGNLALLGGHVVGLLASREVEPTGLLRAGQAFKDLVAADVCVIGGWHSPLESALLEASETAHAELGMLLAAGSEHALLPDRIIERMQDRAAFVLAHCKPNVHRVSRTAALRRNELVVALSDVLLVPLAPSGSATLGAARRAVAVGKPVLTIDLTANRELLAAGARSFTKAALTDALAKSFAD
ncbi:MAG: DNA-processing protein DprA [Deltaproteobacteria bacterium]|nr:DNA-processing protein DprA [Deltaproteobacteria bacterium]